MKPLLISAVIALLLIACNDQTKSEAEVKAASNDMKAVYEKNLATLKSAIAAFEKENLDEYASNFADSVKFYPAAYGAPDGGKAEIKQSASMFFSDWDSLKLVESNFLPGLDSTTHELDGSARYYGVWSGVHKSGFKAKAKVYETFDFNKDNKIVSADQYFDIGGMINAINTSANKK